MRLGLPLHRGPHRAYNEMVIERTGQIEAEWQQRRLTAPDSAGLEALRQLAILQSELRQQLLKPKGARMRLNRLDPLGTGFDYRELDAMAEKLWHATQAVASASAALAA